MKSYIVDSPLVPPIGRQAWITGATAEWITERPTDVPTDDLFELPDYDEVRFKNCFAMSGGLPWLTEPRPGIEQTLDGARLIRMYKVLRQPSRTVTWM